MALLCDTFRRCSVSLLRFPFRRHVQGFSCRITLIYRLKYPYNAIRRDSVSLLRFPFLNHVQVLSNLAIEISIQLLLEEIWFLFWGLPVLDMAKSSVRFRLVAARNIHTIAIWRDSVSFLRFPFLAISKSSRVRFRLFTACNIHTIAIRRDSVSFLRFPFLAISKSSRVRFRLFNAWNIHTIVIWRDSVSFLRFPFLAISKSSRVRFRLFNAWNIHTIVIWRDSVSFLRFPWDFACLPLEISMQMLLEVIHFLS